MQPKPIKPAKTALKELSAKPKKVKTAVTTPKVTYVYRKDAFKKVKIA
jgi:hypothetical protein